MNACFSDIELRAFLDGNVSSDQEAEILAALEGDPISNAAL